MPNIYVLSKEGHPLMPVHHYGRAKRMIRSGKATIVNTKPFTIKLTYDIENPTVEECVLGVDPGRTNIGLCITDQKGKVLYAADVSTRNKEIPKLMQEKKSHRQASRRGERSRRQRRAVKSGISKDCSVKRKLPQCEENITCKVIKNTEARFCNRKRPNGWLTPTARQLLQTHENLINEVCKLLPVSKVVLELNRFDFARMENPDIRNWEYQKGRLFGYKDRNDYINNRQNGHCLFCKKQIDHYHHIKPRSKGGSESSDNIAGLCQDHHGLVHTDKEWADKLSEKQQGLLKKYHALSVINQILPYLVKDLSERHDLYVTTGYETKTTRIHYNLDKDHCIDAWCIAVSQIEIPISPDFETVYQIQQYRRHNRAMINNQRERTYYLDGKAVAKNRHKRFEQKTDSLQEFAEKNPNVVAKLTVKKSVRRYNQAGRALPGSVFLYKGKRYVLSGQLSGGQYYRAVGDMKTNYPARDCRIIHSGGLVYVGESLHLPAWNREPSARKS